MSAFARGLWIAWSGTRMALSNAEVRRAYVKIAAVVMGLTAVLNVVGLWWLWYVPLEQPAELGIGGILWRAAATLVIFLLGPLLVVMTMNIVFPMFNATAFFAGLRSVSPQRAAELTAQQGLPLRRGIYVSIVRLARFLLWSGVAFGVSFIPLVGPVLSPIMQLHVSAMTLGWELLDPYFDKLGLNYASQRRFVARHRAGLLGFGAPYALVFAVPLVGPLCFGLAQAATALFVVDLLEARPPPQADGKGPPS
ncbi:MAG: EI24 domain-containing protein [Myxococcales bacterium FL481]|nr:MAG: EI24 domain-containing protein [Myxococcales bacterium FL481]